MLSKIPQIQETSSGLDHLLIADFRKSQDRETRMSAAFPRSGTMLALATSNALTLQERRSGVAVRCDALQ